MSRQKVFKRMPRQTMVRRVMFRQSASFAAGSLMAGVVVSGIAGTARADVPIFGGPVIGYPYSALGPLSAAPNQLVSDNGTAIVSNPGYYSGAASYGVMQNGVTALLQDGVNDGTSARGLAIAASGITFGDATHWVTYYVPNYGYQTTTRRDAAMFDGAGHVTFLVRSGAHDAIYSSTSQANAVNASGQATGYDAGVTNPGPYSLTDQLAVRWDNDGSVTTMQRLGTSENGTTNAGIALSSDGRVAGRVDFFLSGNAGENVYAGRWNADGSGQILEGLAVSNGHEYTIATGINRHNVVIGFSNSKATWWDAAGQIHKFQTPTAFGGGDFQGEGQAINDNGDMLVSSSGNTQRAVVYDSNANPTILDAPVSKISGIGYSRGWSMNDSGVVAGEAQHFTDSGYAENSHATVWRHDGSAIDLNDLISRDSGWILLSRASSISNTGWVTGIAYYDGEGSNDGQRNFTLQIPAHILNASVAHFTGGTNVLSDVANYTSDSNGLNAKAALGTNTDVFLGDTLNADTANFNAVLGANLTVNSLTFGTGQNTAVGFTVGGTQTLTINAAAGVYDAGAGIVMKAGSAANAIGANVALGASQSWTNQSTNALTVSGNVDLGAHTLTLDGDGDVVLSGAIGGGGGLVKSGAGTVSLQAANTFAGGVVLLNGGLRASGEAATHLLSGPGGVDVRGGRLFIGDGTVNGTTAVAAVRAALASGTHLRSSTAAAGFGLGYGTDPGDGAGDAAGGGTGGGTGGGAGVTICLTLLGDANLDGSVGITDFNSLALNFAQSSGKFWADGDFNYDGGVSIEDFNLLALGFGRSVPAGDAAADSPVFAGLAAFAAAHHDSVAFEAALASVPEPGLLGVAALAGVPLIDRRGRRRRFRGE